MIIGANHRERALTVAAGRFGMLAASAIAACALGVAVMRVAAPSDARAGDHSLTVAQQPGIEVAAAPRPSPAKLPGIDVSPISKPKHESSRKRQRRHEVARPATDAIKQPEGHNDSARTAEPIQKSESPDDLSPLADEGLDTGDSQPRD